MNAPLILLGKVVGTAALATGAVVAGISATHSAAADTASTTKAAQCGHGLGQLDPKLRAALKAARQEPAGQERRQALREVRQDARKGTYGERAQVRALKQANHRLHWRAAAPDDLKAALKAAAKQPAGEQRRSAFAKVRQDAASGSYGDRVEKIAKKRQEHRAACRAERTSAS